MSHARLSVTPNGSAATCRTAPNHRLGVGKATGRGSRNAIVRPQEAAAAPRTRGSSQP